MISRAVVFAIGEPAEPFDDRFDPLLGGRPPTPGLERVVARRHRLNSRQ